MNDYIGTFELPSETGKSVTIQRECSADTLGEARAILNRRVRDENPGMKFKTVSVKKLVY